MKTSPNRSSIIWMNSSSFTLKSHLILSGVMSPEKVACGLLVYRGKFSSITAYHLKLLQEEKEISMTRYPPIANILFLTHAMFYHTITLYTTSSIFHHHTKHQLTNPQKPRYKKSSKCTSPISPNPTAHFNRVSTTSFADL